jgi:hypothetical protein
MSTSSSWVIKAVGHIARTLASTLDHREGLRCTLKIASVCVQAGAPPPGSMNLTSAEYFGER